MKITIKRILSICLVFRLYHCEVFLNRTLLQQWCPDLNNTNLLKLRHKQIAAVDPTTFNGLINLVTLDLFDNQVSSIDRATF